MDLTLLKRKYKVLTSVAVAGMVVLVLLLSPFEVGAAGALKAPAFPKVARASATSLKLTWEKVSGASGYQIFRYDSKAKKYKKVATVSGA
ncbi:MAG: hypothetical protein LBG50_02890, partial [Clostridiales Family XIII bacterium]|nr:hypothetical protein [Clostridiales Family XIII bacterium]